MIERKRVIELARERIDELDKGLYIVDATVSSGNAINVEIDCMEGGVAIIDCMSVSRNIEHNMEEDAMFELLVDVGFKQIEVGLVVKQHEVPFDKIKETRVVISFK